MQKCEFSPCFAVCPEGALLTFKGGEERKKNPEMGFEMGKTRTLDNAVC